MRPWYLGNTTVRSPFRLRDGLIALANSPLGNRIKGRDNETAFAWVLHNSGVVNIVRPDSDVSDLGRKWRAALSQLGFIFPEIPSRSGISQDEIGVPFTITPNGRNLINADTVPGMQECFLRSLAAYFIPSVLERGYPFNMFSPLRHTLSVMLELEQRTGESRLNFLEMGLYVQLTSSDNPLPQVVDSILRFRTERQASTNKRRFDNNSLKAAADEHHYKLRTFVDYADANFRYLKATGLVQSKGRGITVTPEKAVFVRRLVADTHIPGNDRSLLINLCSGATLPTDNRDEAMIVLDDLIAQINRRGVSYSITGRSVQTSAEIDIIRHEIEEILAELNEIEYAERQAQQWQEIVGYMDILLGSRSRQVVNDDSAIAIPQMEAPAYFEWTLWRAFLAIDSLVNRPHTARRFKIDQDFLPISPAPGNGPDLFFEFEDFVVVGEVTLLDSSRQEAAEGEPVRRHVADIVINANKPVYGLFLANKIDSNTAETFRIGVWYTRNDTRMRLDIIPLTLLQFKAFFEAMFSSGNVRVATVRELLDACSTFRPDLYAPEWKSKIDEIVRDRARVLRESSA